MDAHSEISRSDPGCAAGTSATLPGAWNWTRSRGFGPKRWADHVLRSLVSFVAGGCAGDAWLDRVAWGLGTWMAISLAVVIVRRVQSGSRATRDREDKRLARNAVRQDRRRRTASGTEHIEAPATATQMQPFAERERLRKEALWPELRQRLLHLRGMILDCGQELRCSEARFRAIHVYAKDLLGRAFGEHDRQTYHLAFEHDRYHPNPLRYDGSKHGLDYLVHAHARCLQEFADRFDAHRIRDGFELDAEPDWRALPD